MKTVLTVLLATAVPGVALGQGIHAVRAIPGYHCMSLVNQWNGEGPQPPPTYTFRGPEKDAPRLGWAAGTVIVADAKADNGSRLSILLPNGKIAWIDRDAVRAFNVVSDPNASCRPVQLSNGRFGTDGRP